MMNNKVAIHHGRIFRPTPYYTWTFEIKVGKPKIKERIWGIRKHTEWYLNLKKKTFFIINEKMMIEKVIWIL